MIPPWQCIWLRVELGPKRSRMPLRNGNLSQVQTVPVHHETYGMSLYANRSPEGEKAGNSPTNRNSDRPGTRLLTLSSKSWGLLWNQPSQLGESIRVDTYIKYSPSGVTLGLPLMETWLVLVVSLRRGIWILFAVTDSKTDLFLLVVVEV